MLRREEEDTRDVREFIDWVKGSQNREIRRIAGLLGPTDGPVAEAELGPIEREDFLMALKKKTSKTGEESRYQGTVLGIPAEVTAIKIEGGPSESINDWNEQTRKRAVKLDAIAQKGDSVSKNGLGLGQGDVTMGNG